MSSFFADMRSHRHALWLFIPFVLFYASSYFQRTAIPGTAFNDLQTAYGLTAAQIAGIGASFLYIYSFCQIIIGWLADKYGGVRIASVGGAIFCAGVVTFPFFGGNMPLMCLSRFLTGLGASSLYLSLVREIDRVFGRKNYSVMLGIVYFVGYAGGLFGTLPYAQLCKYFNWNGILIWIGVISACLYTVFMAARPTVPPAPVSAEPLSLKPLWVLMKNPFVWVLLVNTAMPFATYSLIQMVFGIKFLQDFAGMKHTAAAAVVFSMTLTSMFTILGSGILTRLISNRRKPLLITSAALVLANTVFMFAAVRFNLPGWCFAAGYLLFAAASGLTMVNIMLVQELNSRDTMTLAAGFMNLAGYLSVAVFSMLIGLLLDSFVPPDAFAAGKTVIYPGKAYMTLFGLLMIPASISFGLSFLVPETGGHYLHNCILDRIRHTPDGTAYCQVNK